MRLSSYLTFFYKLVFPTLWLGGFGVGTIVLILSRRPTLSFVPLAVATLVGLLLCWRALFPLEKVEAGLL